MQNTQTVEKGGYFIFNTVFLVLQAGLLLAAVIWNFIQARYEMDILVFLIADVILCQMFFSECCGILIGILSYKARFHNARIWFDAIGLMLSLFLLGWLFVMGMLAGVEGTPFPAAFFVEAVSITVLLVKTIVDAVLRIRAAIRQKKKA